MISIPYISSKASTASFQPGPTAQYLRIGLLLSLLILQCRIILLVLFLCIFVSGIFVSVLLVLLVLLELRGTRIAQGTGRPLGGPTGCASLGLP